MILNQIMSEPKKNHEPQHQKIENKFTVSIGEPKTDQNNHMVQAG